MQFLRTMFWVVLAVLGAIFAMGNWRPVTVSLWSDIVLDTPLPVLMLGSFLLGLVPMIVLHRATRWSLKRRLDTAQRELDETRAVAGAPTSVGTKRVETTAVDATPAGAMPFASVPLVPPPGVA